MSSAVLRRFVDTIDQINESCGRAVAWLTLAMVVVTFLVVLLRYLFSLGWIGMQESITWLHATVFMLGSAYTLRHAGHVRVDIFYRKASPRFRALVDLAGSLLLLLPVCVFILWISWEYVAASWSLREASGEAGGLPGVFLLKSLILVMALLLILQGLAEAARSVLILRGETDPTDEQGPEEL